MAVWLADQHCIDELLEKASNINEVDKHGATPLMLAVELLPRAREYERILHHLLEKDADPRLRSSLGWSPLDEAVSRGDQQLVRTLFASTQRNLRQRWKTRLGSITQSLEMLPDFECKIRWEFESPVLPLLNKIAPSDVIWLRKQGTSLRVDSTLASWKRFRRSKRRDLTTLFQGGTLNNCHNSHNVGYNSASPSLCQLNHTKQTVSDVTEGFNEEETSAVVNDLISGDAMQWDMQVDNMEIAEATTWLGGVAGLTEINGWEALRFDVRGTLGVTVRQKGSRRNCHTFQQYFGCPLPSDACLPELREGFKLESASAKFSRQSSRNSNWSKPSGCTNTGDNLQNQAINGEFIPDIDTMSTTSEVLSQWPDQGYSSLKECDNRDCTRSPLHIQQDSMFRGATPQCNQDSQDKSNTAVVVPSSEDVGNKGKQSTSRSGMNDKIGKTSHRVSASVWLATNFAIPMQQFLPIFEALSIEHDAMRRLKDLLNSQNLQNAAERAKQVATAADTSVSSFVGSTSGNNGTNVFPVRATVPLNLAVRASVHFEAFELRPPGSFPDDLFEVPTNYRWTPRHEAQKTTSRTKKRMLFANLAL